MTIHRYWCGDGPPRNASLTAKVASSVDDVRDWTDKDLPADVRSWMDSNMFAVDPAYYARHRANMARLWILHTHGGIWIDYDVWLFRLPADPPFTAGQHGGLCSAVMGFPPYHPFLAAAVGAIPRDAGSDRRSHTVSGELLLRSLLFPSDDITIVDLPFDVRGCRMNDDVWAVHTYQGTHG